MSFTDISLGATSGWSWDFEDDGEWNSHLQHPFHVFSTPGPHRVTFEVSNAYGPGRITKTVSVIPAGSNPYISAVTREYPGFFLEGTVATNTFDVEVDWRGTPGTVSFSIDGAPSIVEPGTTSGAAHTFNLGSDFSPGWSGSEMLIIATNGEGLSSSPLSQYVYVYPFPSWLVDAISLGFGDLTFTAGGGEVRADLSSEFPVPHFREGCTLECALDDECDDCLRIPHFVPYINGAFDLLETYASIDGSVSSTGVGGFSIHGQTGFFALGGGDTSGGVYGEVGGSGSFRLFPPEGMELTQASFRLYLEGVLTKSVGILDAVPALSSAESWPVIGGVMKTINQVATITGQLEPQLEFTARFSQGPTGTLEFADGTGALDLDLLATLAIPLDTSVGHVDLRAWVGGGGGFTLGVPEPLLRELDLRFQTGASLELDSRSTFAPKRRSTPNASGLRQPTSRSVRLREIFRDPGATQRH